MELIDKDALVAEIEKIRAKWFGINNDFAGGQKGALTNVLSFIDTLEVKEVDLDKEIDLEEDKYYGFDSLSRADIIDIAKHFFELGLKAQKGGSND